MKAIGAILLLYSAVLFSGFTVEELNINQLYPESWVRSPAALGFGHFVAGILCLIVPGMFRRH